MYFKDLSIRIGKNLLIRFPRKIKRLFEFIFELHEFKANSDDRFPMLARDTYPCLTDKIKTTPFDQHYIYHTAWAARILAKTKPELHIDFSSILYFGTILSAFISVKFYDYRPANISLSGWEGHFADLGKLNFEDELFSSISCMHTIEHIGLGRYGDQLDPKGDIKAVNELIRVTKKGGNILFVTPVGKKKIEFNAHRIYSYELVMQLFKGCVLKEFSLVPDAGGLIENADPKLVIEQQYGCGCFWFIKGNN